MARIMICKDCGEEKTHYAKGLCGKCYVKKWNESNPEKWKASRQKYREANSEKRKVYTKKWSEDNPEYQKKWYEDNWGSKKDYQKKWREDNPDKVKEYTKRWKQNNPEKRRRDRHIYRTHKKGNGGSYTTEEWEQLVCDTGNVCLSCGKSGDDIKLTIDHIIPLSKGGTSAIDNLQPLCFSCNASKGAKETTYLEKVLEN